MRSDYAWLKIRRQLLERLKAQVQSRIGASSPELKRYQKQFARRLPKRWRKSSKERLLAQMEKADFVFGADFHAFSQSQRLHLRLLRGLLGRRKIRLACEFLEVKHQKWVDLLQSGKISEKEFLSKTRWKTRWGFPWEWYRVLLDFARENEIEVLALNHVGKSFG